ncbi:hypothetical protein [Nocardia fluminea]|uniref:Uncharacterized protein n=1 Tax=Nocardia fluminea TaxID=134984 RepID=A0A2N3VGX9_9NOCA|nr:hypothetical protein [Nocardia fluminea]PKV80889.1 hypothetical protein ATK86_5326 [Nocardia fluminea]
MSDIVKVETGRSYRLFDEDYRLIGTWSQMPPADELIDGRCLTVDYEGGTRWSGRIVDGSPVHDIEFLKPMHWPSNPLLSIAPDEEGSGS